MPRPRQSYSDWPVHWEVIITCTVNNVFRIFEKKTHMLWKHPAPYLVVSSQASLASVASLASPSTKSSLIPRAIHLICPTPKNFLTWWPCSLTYDPDLRTWPRYFSTWPTCRNSGLYVCPFSHARWNTHTHRHTMSKLLHPSLTWGVIRSGETYIFLACSRSDTCHTA